MLRKSEIRWIVVNVLIVSAVVVTFMFLPKNQAAADEIIVAGVVAGFIQPFQESVSVYEAKTGIKINAAFSSAGRFYGQIINSAPYDIFLSSDKERPALLYSKAICKEPFIYARGEIAL